MDALQTLYYILDMSHNAVSPITHEFVFWYLVYRAKLGVGLKRAADMDGCPVSLFVIAFFPASSCVCMYATDGLIS